MFFADVFLFKVNTIMSENCLWKVSLTLLCYFSTGKYLMGSCVWFRLTLCFGQRFAYILQSSSYCIQDLTTVCISSFSFERYPQIIYIAKFGTILVFANLQEFKVLAQRQGPLTASEFVLLKVSNSGDKWIQVRPGKSDFPGVLRQNLNQAKLRSCVEMLIKFSNKSLC